MTWDRLKERELWTYDARDDDEGNRKPGESEVQAGPQAADATTEVGDRDGDGDDISVRHVAGLLKRVWR